MKNEKKHIKLKVSSPGRINLIGEHLDYNGGYVLPAAIDLGIHFSFEKTAGDVAEFWSEDFKQGTEIDLKNLKIVDAQWQNYISGVLYFLDKLKPGKISGFKCSISSDLPIGSGVSSSAALECGIAVGVNKLFNLNLSNEDLIIASNKAEHDFVGANCGIMDQFAIIMGKEKSLMHLNCRTLAHDYIKVDLAPYKILMLNTNVSHNISTSGYNKRRTESEEALHIIKSSYPEYQFLADVPMSILLKFEKTMETTLFRRAKYVVEESHRVKKSISAINKMQLDKLGKLLYASHAGLSELYEVSCRELDFLVDFSKQHECVIGSRMMGGGFGGCTINLVHESNVEDYASKVSKAYHNEFGFDLSAFVVTIGDGAKIVSP